MHDISKLHFEVLAHSPTTQVSMACAGRSFVEMRELEMEMADPEFFSIIFGFTILTAMAEIVKKDGMSW